VLAIYDSENSRIPIYREKREWRQEGMLEGRGWCVGSSSGWRRMGVNCVLSFVLSFENFIYYLLKCEG